MIGPFRSKDNGSISFAAGASILSLSLAAMYSLNQTARTSSIISAAKRDIQAEGLASSAMSTLATYKALLAPRRVGSGEYQPSLYPTDYYDVSWKLSHNNAIAKGPIDSMDGDSVAIRGLDVDTDSAVDTDALLAGQKSVVNLSNTVRKVRILKPNLVPGSSSLVGSIDVEIMSESIVNGKIKKVKVGARVPIPPPEAVNPVIEFSPAGANAWIRDPTDLSGKYDIRVLGSGVVYYAKLMIGNSGPFILGGFDEKNGKIKHGATNVLARDVEIGRWTYDFASGTPGEVDYKIDDPKVTCKAVTVVGAGVPAADVKVVATLVNPAQETSTVSGTTTIIVKPAAASAAASPTDVDFDAISQICENKCNYIYPDVVGEEGPSYLGKVDVLRQAQVGAKTFTDYSWGYMRWIREETGAKDVKICENMQKPFDSAKKAFGKDPDQLWMLLSSGWNDLTYYYYRAPDCNRKFLMDRTSCGCFQEDTQITLGDGQSTRAIHELTESDRVWNPILKKAQRIKRMTRGPEALPMLTIQTASGSVTVTGGHPFPLPDGSIVQAHDLKAGDQVLVNEAWETILTVEIKQSAQQPVVWNLELTGDDRQDSHFILANGIVTGDLKIQEDIGVKK